MLTLSVVLRGHWLVCNKKMSKNPKKLMKIVNIDGENLLIFWTKWGISMKTSGKMWLMIILKVIQNQAFTLSLEDAFLQKPQKGWGGGWGGGGGAQNDPSSLLSVKKENKNILYIAYILLYIDVIFFSTELLVKKKL